MSCASCVWKNDVKEEEWKCLCNVGGFLGICKQCIEIEGRDWCGNV